MHPHGLHEIAGSRLLVMRGGLGKARISRWMGAMKIPPCEVEVIKGLCTGETEKEIACRLGKSSHTVHNQVNQAMKRFNVRCRTSLAIAAIRDGIIQIDTIRLLQRE